MRELKVGDKVRIVGDFEDYYKYVNKSRRDVHTIRNINCYNTPNYYYKVNNWWFPKEGCLEYALIGGKIDEKV